MSLSKLLNFPKDLQVIIFDFDGTIVKLHVDWDALRKILSEKYMNDFGEVQTFKQITKDLQKVVIRGDPELIDSYIRTIEKFERENVREYSFLEDVIYFIKNLENLGINSNVKLAIFSLNFRSTIFTILSQHDLLGRFHYIVGREDVVEWKPDPEGLFKILKHFNVSNNRSIYVGDSEFDLEAGKNAKIKTYLIENFINKIRKVKKNNKLQ